MSASSIPIELIDEDRFKRLSLLYSWCQSTDFLRYTDEELAQYDSYLGLMSDAAWEEFTNRDSGFFLDFAKKHFWDDVRVFRRCALSPENFFFRAPTAEMIRSVPHVHYDLLSLVRNLHPVVTELVFSPDAKDVLLMGYISV